MITNPITFFATFEFLVTLNILSITKNFQKNVKKQFYQKKIVPKIFRIFRGKQLQWDSSFSQDLCQNLQLHQNNTSGVLWSFLEKLHPIESLKTISSCGKYLQILKKFFRKKFESFTPPWKIRPRIKYKITPCCTYNACANSQ